MALSGILCYLLAVAAAWLFRLAYLGWFGGFLLWLVILLPPVVSLLSLPAMLSMRLALEAPESVTQGEEAELCLLFQSKRRFPVGQVRVRLRIENLYTGEQRRESFRFDAVSLSRSLLPLPTADCGALRLSVERWTCADALGLLALRRARPDAVTCVILPQAAEPENAGFTEPSSQTQPRLKPKYGGGFAEDHELRAYRPGDSMNSVHWKLSSKMDELIVREALVPENDKIYLILQANAADDRGLQTLLWLSQQLNRRELPHLIVANEVYPVADGAGTLAALKKILSAPKIAAVSCELSDARAVYRVKNGEVRVC